jgi:hypothetical protein
MQPGANQIHESQSAHGEYKFNGSLSGDRDDFGSEFGGTSTSGIGTIKVGLPNQQP